MIICSPQCKGFSSLALAQRTITPVLIIQFESAHYMFTFRKMIYMDLCSGWNWSQWIWFDEMLVPQSEIFVFCFLTFCQLVFVWVLLVQTNSIFFTSLPSACWDIKRHLDLIFTFICLLWTLLSTEEVFLSAVVFSPFMSFSLKKKMLFWFMAFVFISLSLTCSCHDSHLLNYFL